jgi:hypothetical protein
LQNPYVPRNCQGENKIKLNTYRNLIGPNNEFVA